MERGTDWQEQRLKALNRDKKCRLCGYDKNLAVHHVIPYWKSKSNELKNLITLCQSCHTKEDNFFRQFNQVSKKIIKEIIK